MILIKICNYFFLLLLFLFEESLSRRRANNESEQRSTLRGSRGQPQYEKLMKRFTQSLFFFFFTRVKEEVPN